MRPLIGVRFERTGGGVPETRRIDARFVCKLGARAPSMDEDEA